MLNEFLKVAYEKSEAQRQQSELVSLMKELPVGELHKIAQTGEIKLATNLCGDDKSWLDQFKGTPFMEQAIALEQEYLQNEMASQQQNQAQSQRSQQSWAQADQIRMKKKLLELQKAKSEMGTLAEAGVPVSGAVPGEAGPEQGPPPSEGMPPKQASAAWQRALRTGKATAEDFGDTAVRMAKKRTSHVGDMRKNVASTMSEPGPWQKSTVHGMVDQPFSRSDWHVRRNATKAAKTAAVSADAVGRLMANQDMAKTPHQRELQSNKKHASVASHVAAGGAGVGALLGSHAGHHGRQSLREASERDPESRLKAFAAKHPKKLLGLIGAGMAASSGYGAAKGVGHLAAKLKKHGSVEQVGRVLARRDMDKIAHQRELLQAGDYAGRLMAKNANLGGALLRIAKNNPGMLIGGGLGALHGALKEDGGVGSAIGEGLLGAAAGHAIGGVGKHMYHGKGVGDALKAYGHETAREGKIVGGHLGLKSKEPLMKNVPKAGSLEPKPD